MKLAEALILRSDTQKRYNAVQARAQAVARHQGEESPEDANLPLAQAEEMLDELEGLLRPNNLTNAPRLRGKANLAIVPETQQRIQPLKMHRMFPVWRVDSPAARQRMFALLQRR